MIPVSVIAGYLGAGKTTLVNHLLRNASGSRIAVLVNEFGELPIDADLIESRDGAVIAIAGGCVCCSYGSDLAAALMDMAGRQPRPDHLVIEASGVALPGGIARAVALMPDYRLDGVIVLADAETVRRRAADPYMGDTVTRQLDDADLVLLNKVDLIGEAERREVLAWLRRRVSGRPVLQTDHGELAVEVVLGYGPGPGDAGRWRDAPVSEHDHGHDDTYRTVTLVFHAPLNARALGEALAGAGLIRAKGFVVNDDGAAWLVQSVGQRWQAEPAPSQNMNQGRVVCIGSAQSGNLSRLPAVLSQFGYCHLETA